MYCILGGEKKKKSRSLCKLEFLMWAINISLILDCLLYSIAPNLLSWWISWSWSVVLSWLVRVSVIYHWQTEILRHLGLVEIGPKCIIMTLEIMYSNNTKPNMMSSGSWAKPGCGIFKILLARNYPTAIFLPKKNAHVVASSTQKLMGYSCSTSLYNAQGFRLNSRSNF